MSLGGYIRRKIFWHFDKKSGAVLWDAYNDVSEIMKNCNGENCKKIKERLNDLLVHATETTEYYAPYKRNGEKLSLTDFPVVNKLIVNDNKEKIRSSKYLNCKLHEMHTSGSTGAPFTIQQDSRKRKRVIAEIKAIYGAEGYESHEKMAYINNKLREERSIPFMKQFYENIYRFPMPKGDEAHVEKIVKFFVKKKPVALHAAANYLIILINYIKRKGISPSQFNMKTIFTGSEFVPDKIRDDLIEIFGDKCKVFVKYSNEEMGILGMDSGPSTPYRLNVANYYFEVLKIGSDEPVNDGEIGRIVITDLFNYATPLIRYDTGDLGAIKKEPNKWPVLTNLHGKKLDMIFSTDGDMVPGVAFAHIHNEVKNIDMWQFVQVGKKEYIYKVVSSDGRELINIDELLNKMHEIVGEDAIIKVEYVNEILTISSGKRRYTVNEFCSVEDMISKS